MQILAPAKINTYLKITGKREDGYHLLDSQVYFTKLADKITVEPNNTQKDSFTCIDNINAQIEADNNSLLAASQLFRQEFSTADYYDINIEKNIPVGAGLGGGSSDAAAIIYLLAEQYKFTDKTTKLHNIASKIGADVNVCLEHFLTQERLFQISGIGEIVSVIDNKKSFEGSYLALIYPHVSVSTPKVYKHFSQYFYPVEDINISNHLQPASEQLEPKIRQIISKLQKLVGCEKAQMTGSGSCCFGVFDRAVTSQELEKIFPEYFVHTEKM